MNFLLLWPYQFVPSLGQSYRYIPLIKEITTFTDEQLSIDNVLLNWFFQ